MTVQEYQKYLATKANEIQAFISRVLPVKVGEMAQRHYQDNFRKSGFVNGGLAPWQRSKRQSGKGTSAGYGTLLSQERNLMKGVEYTAGVAKVRVHNDVPYASVHNFGETVHPTVTPKMRRFAWAKFFEGAGIKKTDTAKAKKEKTEAASKDTLAWRGMALTKKQKLSIKMPQRQFLGESKELNEQIAKTREDGLTKILKF